MSSTTDRTPLMAHAMRRSNIPSTMCRAHKHPTPHLNTLNNTLSSKYLFFSNDYVVVKMTNRKRRTTTARALRATTARNNSAQQQRATTARNNSARAVIYGSATEQRLRGSCGYVGEFCLPIPQFTTNQISERFDDGRPERL